MKTATGTLVVALAIGALLGFGGGYYYMQPQVEDAYAEGMAYQAAIEPAAVTVTPASLEIEFDNDAFDHSGTVDADGNVAADVSITNTLTIENDGETDSRQVYVTLHNPITNRYGLHEDLEYDDTRVTLAVGGLSQLPLYRNGEYADAYQLGVIPAGALASLDITVTLLENDDENYPDGKNLKCYVYVWQPASNWVDTIEFTVNT